MTKVKIFIKKVLFNMEFWYFTNVIKRTDNIFSYPILVDLTLNKDKYFQKYLKGISVFNSIKYKLDSITKNIERKMNRSKPTLEVRMRMNRLYELKCKRAYDNSYINSLEEKFKDFLKDK